MKLIEKIKQEQLKARKNKDKFKAGILTCLYSEANIIGKNNGDRQTTDEECIKCITKFKKGTNDNIRILRDLGKNARDIAPLLQEVGFYDEFLPKQMTKSELTEYIKETIALGANNIGAVMKVMKTEINGQYDGKMASGLIKELL
jgi:hypothetical protein